MFASGFFAKASVPSAGQCIQSAKQCSLSLFKGSKSSERRVRALEANVRALENKVSSAAGRLRPHEVAECRDLVAKYRGKAGAILRAMNSKPIARSQASLEKRNEKRARIQELDNSLERVTASLLQSGGLSDRTQQLTDRRVRQAVGLGYENAPLPPKQSAVFRPEQATQTDM